MAERLDFLELLAERLKCPLVLVARLANPVAPVVSSCRKSVSKSSGIRKKIFPRRTTSFGIRASLWLSGGFSKSLGKSLSCTLGLIARLTRPVAPVVSSCRN